jgi:hypothetical protein
MTGWLEALPEPLDLRFVGPQIELPRWQDLAPIAALCGISIPCSLLWLLVEWEYAAGKNRKTSDATRSTRREQGHP